MNQYNLNVTISANTKEEAEQELQVIMQMAAEFPALLATSLLLKYEYDGMVQDQINAHKTFKRGIKKALSVTSTT